MAPMALTVQQLRELLAGDNVDQDALVSVWGAGFNDDTEHYLQGIQINDHGVYLEGSPEAVPEPVSGYPST